MRPTVALDNLLPAVVRRWLLEPDAPQHRPVMGTVLSADISGFTRLAEHLATQGVRAAGEALTDAINLCFEPMIDVAVELGGDVLKFGGDAIFVLFEGDHSEHRACVAAARMQEVIGVVELGIEAKLSMTIGIATGTVDLVLAGTTRRELIVLGPTVDWCLQLEANADRGEIRISTDTASAVPDGWVVEVEQGILALAPLNADLIRLGELESRPGDAVDVGPELADEYGAALAEALGSNLVEAVGAFTDTAGEVRIVTIGFVDVPVRDLAPDQVSAIIERVNVLCERYRITMTTADVYEGAMKLVLVAGAPTARGDEEDAMLHAVTDLVHGSTDVVLTCGVNRGLVFVGFVGSPRYRTFTIMGDAVNLAARLMVRAERGTVVTSAGVLARSRTIFETIERPPLLVRGRTEPVTVHQVGQVLGPAPSSRPKPPLIARVGELALLRDALDRARRGSGSVVELRGDVGIGRARLVDELIESLPMGVLLFETTATAAGSTEPWSTVRDLLRGVAGVSELDDPEVIGNVMTSWIARGRADLVPMAPILAAAFGATVPSTTDADAVESRFRVEFAAELLVELLDSSLTSPTIIVVRELGRADGASRRLLYSIAKRVGDRPWCLVTTGRADLEPLAANSIVVPVEPLSLDDTIRLVRQVADLPDARGAEVAARAAGNPLFAIELAETAGLVAELPGSIESVVTARIDRLGHVGRVLIRTASVLGEEMLIDLLADVAGERVFEVLPSLGELVEVVDGTVARFRSPLIREVAYNGLSARRRAELHGDVASALELAGADAGSLALHHGLAGNCAEAWTHAVRAGREAVGLGAMRLAFDHFSGALAAAEALKDISSAAIREVHLELFGAGIAGGMREQALVSGERAVVLTEDPFERAALLANVVLERAEGDGSYSGARDTLEVELAECAPGPEGAAPRAAFLSTMAGFSYRLGEHDLALLLAEQAVADAELGGAARQLARARFVAHNVLGDRADPRRFEYGARVLEAAEASGDLELLGIAHSNVGLDLYYHGDWETALYHYQQAAALSIQRGDTVRLFYPRLNEAIVRADQGRFDEARPVIDDLRRSTAYGADGYAHAVALRELGRLEVRAGRTDEGRRWLSEAKDWFAAAGDSDDRIETELHLVSCSLAEGRSEVVLASEADLLVGIGDDHLPAHLVGMIDYLMGYALLQRADAEGGAQRLEAAVEAADGVCALNHLLALVGLSEAERALGRNRASGRTRQRADELRDRLGVVALPYVPLPR